MNASPPVPGNTPEYSVSELAGALKRTVEDRFGQVRVRGELSGFKRHTSGHWYGCMKDSTAVIDLVFFKGPAAALTFRPEDGLEVIATGRLTTYPGRSKYQIVVERMEPAGVGAMLAQIEARRQKLAAEGLFDAARKKPLPYLPEVIGVVTSPTGAVIRDILHRLADRFPRRVLVWPVAVQGEGAAAQVAAAIAGFNALTPGGAVPRPDLLIVARGGGSIEDLAAFNEEIVVRAAAASAIPLISAVGHETDTTLIDFAADRRAPTPTAAAEMAVPVLAELRAVAGEYGVRLDRAATRLLSLGRERATAVAQRLPRAEALLDQPRQRADDAADRLPRALSAGAARWGERFHRAGGGLRPALLTTRLEQAGAALGLKHNRLGSAARGLVQRDAAMLARDAGRLRPFLLTGQKERAAARLGEAGRLLASLGPEQVLGRGYAIVTAANGHLVTSAKRAAQEQALALRFADGEIRVSTATGRQGSLF